MRVRKLNQGVINNVLNLELVRFIVNLVNKNNIARDPLERIILYQRTSRDDSGFFATISWHE